MVLFDWETGKPQPLCGRRRTFQGTAWGVAFHPAGFMIGVRRRQRRRRCGSGRRPTAASVHTLTLPTNARDLALHPAGGRFAVAAANGTAYQYALA